MATPVIDPARAVLLVMDYQVDILANFVSIDDQMLQRAGRVIAEVRNAKIPIIYVVVQFRSVYPEVADRGLFKIVRTTNRLVEGAAGSAIHEAVAPKEGDIVVTKRRVGA